MNGRVCDGYAPKIDPQSAPVTSPNVGSSLNVAAVLPQADSERRHFQFFVERTAPELSGYFDYEFYKRLLLQISRDEPAVRHALVALGSLHEGIKAQEEDGGALRSSSLKEYNMAIGNLSRNSTKGKQSISVTLICCLLFIWLETLQGNHVVRMQQLTSGLNILREWQRNVRNDPSSFSDPEVRFIRQQLVPIYTRLDLQGVTFESGRQPQLELQTRLENPRSRGIPAAFTSVEEARDWLDIILYWLHKSVSSEKPPGPLPAPLDGQLYLEQWRMALDEFFHTQRANVTEAQGRACTILRIYQKMSGIMLASRTSFDESDYEPFNHQFRSITILAESLFNASKNGSLDGFRFSFEMGVVAPLFYVSSKCQNQIIRSRAVFLLMKCPQQAGVWYGLGVAKMASLGATESLADVEMEGTNAWVGRYDAAAETGSPVEANTHPDPTPP